MVALSATDVRNWVYCPRVFFYMHSLGSWRPTTPKMKLATEVHRDERNREVRRVQRFYGMADAERVFEPDLYSERLHLSGRPDLVLIGSGESVPVEFKLTDREPSANQLAQLGVYALLIDETSWPSARRGFIRLIPSRRTYELPLGADLRRTILSALGPMRDALTAGERPAATPVRSRCRACEYRSLCPDIDSSPESPRSLSR